MTSRHLEREKRGEEDQLITNATNQAACLWRTEAFRAISETGSICDAPERNLNKQQTVADPPACFIGVDFDSADSK